MNLHVRRVSIMELEDFSAILKEAAAWLQTSGKEMWSAEQVSVDNLLRDYSLDQLFLGHVNDRPAATIILQETDELFWPDVPQGESVFIHKFSIRRVFAKTGLSQRMLYWAKQEAKRRQKKYVRLDCAADRRKLCQFYEDQGFRKVDERLVHTYPTAFYEYEVSSD
ncbi:MAG: GNAT family N-acetyltransferase [Alicyclobacillus shizuokensis]|nr:GNAT family N-acetyltransferase [Alicyclobacillus shizuokensis]